ncbi:MAG: hypothetical protein GXO64_04345 [Candidatus Micrarchaeota archaeon]|nr:hypothetical protein [Candidatus Micrarchaeota archaeon]
MRGILFALVIFGTVLLLAFGIPSEAVTRTDEINVSVTVAQKTMIDVTPTSLTWTNVDPGSEADSSYEANSYGQIQIENIGSTNITGVWINNTYPASRPFGSGTNASYDAGNFVVLSRQSSTDYMFPNRVEYNASNTIVYVSVPTGWYYGRFRNASHEYFWGVDAASGDCNVTGRVFRIGITEHNQSATGDADLSDGGTDTRYYQFTLTNAPDNTAWGYASINVSSSKWQMCVAVKNTCDEAMFYRWNTDAPGGSSCAYAQNFTTSTLTPGSWVIANVHVRVPYGVHWGTTGSTQGKLTVIAQSSYSN